MQNKIKGDLGQIRNLLIFLSFKEKKQLPEMPNRTGRNSRVRSVKFNLACKPYDFEPSIFFLILVFIWKMRHRVTLRIS
jgi:hypothetical protein